MYFDINRLRENVRKSKTEDLLDRVTVYRTALEPNALPVILEELQSRGIAPTAISEHEKQRGTVVRGSDGVTRICTFCRKPATTVEWGWYRMFRRLPLFPRKLYLCQEHRSPDEE